MAKNNEKTSPRKVGSVRGIVEGAIAGLCLELADYLPSAEVPDKYTLLIPVGVFLLRWLEAEFLDEETPEA